jgi:hypothetical protein
MIPIRIVIVLIGRSLSVFLLDPLKHMGRQLFQLVKIRGVVHRGGLPRRKPAPQHERLSLAGNSRRR